MTDPFPDVVRVEPVGLCNFRCRHCLTGQKPNRRQQMPYHKFQQILSQFVEADQIPRVMVFYHGGEPLLNQDLESFIAAAKEAGVQKTVITTNGSLLDEDRAKALLDVGLDEMKVSFDGNSAEENNWVRRNADFFHDAGNIKHLLQIKKERGLDYPTVRISNVSICSEQDVDRVYESGMEPVDTLPEYIQDFFAEYLDLVDYQTVTAMVWPGYQVEKPFSAKSFPSLKPRYCSIIFETVSILANGDIVPCCYDIGGQFVVGNVFENSIFDIWENQEYIEFRKDFRKGKYNNLCLSCKNVIPRLLCQA